ncbi:MAG TPA: hypothetical protein VKE51_39270 [Vicinamibacterales bacterium]|nr:hypothetical protein [Vicinamibacterales bacterium]
MEAAMMFGRDEWILAFVLGVCALIGIALAFLKYFEQVAKLARSRAAAPPGAEPWAVTSAFLASTRWGCSRTGPALSSFCNALFVQWFDSP